MKIYTKTGDAGTTSLVGGTRVSKSHPRVMTYGVVDELISYFGVLRCDTEEEETLRRIQVQLMQVAAHFAADHDVAKLKPLDDNELIFLEEEIDRMTAMIPVQKAFVLPSVPRSSSICHIARTVCRRAERSAILIENKSIEDEKSIRYLNRLSDYLFTLARYLCTVHGIEDDYWIP